MDVIFNHFCYRTLVPRRPSIPKEASYVKQATNSSVTLPSGATNSRRPSVVIETQPPINNCPSRLSQVCSSGIQFICFEH